MQDIIDIYFEEEELPTVTGLALALDFTSRQALLNYQIKPEFVDTVKRAKLRIENHLEKTLYRHTGAAGVIFNLKNNFGWKDAQQLEHVGSGGGPVALTVKWVDAGSD